MMTHYTRRLGALAFAALCITHVACTERTKTTPDRPIEAAASGVASRPVADAPKAPELPDPSPAPRPSAPMVPNEGDMFRPSMATLTGDFDVRTFADASSCRTCHAEIVGEWRESVHSFASLSNPMYLVAFDDFKADKGAKNTQLCAGCHDIALMMSGKLAEDADPMDEASHAGVSCVSCHGITATKPRGNGSYTLDANFPVPAADDQAAIDAHAKTLTERTKAQSNAMCVTCHRGVLTQESGHDVVIPGLDEFGSWRDSAYNGQHTARLDDVTPQDCVGCHMPKVDGRASHRFAGGHSTLAAMLGSEDQLDAVRAQVEGAVTLDLMAARGHAPDRLVFDVVVFNERVGHHFPAGAKDLRDTWVEVEVRDAKGRLVAQDGTAHAADADPTSAHVMQVRLASSIGETQDSHEVAHFRAPVFDHTIGPRDADALRYAMDLSRDHTRSGPLTITATMKHRRLTKTLMERACELSKTPRGAAFLDGAERYKGLRPDPCAPQPILTVASVTGTVGASIHVPARASTPTWLRHYRHGLA
ncbi:MAG: multiheme c-type cytochrome, partial [Myxococcota bacterium]